MKDIVTRCDLCCAETGDGGFHRKVKHGEEWIKVSVGLAHSGDICDACAFGFLSDVLETS